MTRTERQRIFDKYNGRCAYCGCELESGWHVDELLPIERKYKYRQSYWENIQTGDKIPSLHLKPEGVSAALYNHVKGRWVPDGCKYPENLNYDNQMPACASCNINKHSMSLEDFRALIEGFMKHLNTVNTQYKIAKRYGLVSEDIKPVVFYFENLTPNK